MKRRFGLILLQAISIAGLDALSAGEALGLEALVTVDGGARRGQAALFTRGDGCFALTPQHVLGGERYATVAIPAASGVARYAQGDLCAKWPDVDLALLRVTGHAADGCGEPLTTAAPIERILPAGGAGTLRYSNQDGSTERIDVIVTFRGADHVIGIRPRGSEHPLTQGLSGGSLYLSNLRAGFLIAADDATGEGVVLRLDHTVGLLNALFDRQEGAVMGDSACLVGTTLASAADDGTRIDYASATNGARIVEWSAPPLSSGHRPDLLLAPADRSGYWAVETSGSAFAVIRLAAVQTISEIDVDLSQVPAAQRPGALAILTRASESGPWTQVAGAQATDSGASRTFAFAPRRIMAIRIEVMRESPGRHPVGLGRVAAFR